MADEHRPAVSGHGCIGLIGAGRMGAAMGKRLAEAGHELHVYDVDPETLTVTTFSWKGDGFVEVGRRVFPRE